MVVYLKVRFEREYKHRPEKGLASRLIVGWVSEAQTNAREPSSGGLPFVDPTYEIMAISSRLANR